MNDAEIVEWWNERAAIIEHDGRRSRENAERVAAICVRRNFGRIPDAVLKELNAHKQEFFDGW